MDFRPRRRNRPRMPISTHARRGYVRAGRRSFHRRIWTSRSGRTDDAVVHELAQAEALAMMAAALARATSGTVTNRRIRSARTARTLQADRRVRAARSASAHADRCARYIAYRAALWDIDRRSRASAHGDSSSAARGAARSLCLPASLRRSSRRRNCSCSTGLKQHSLRRSSTLQPGARC